MLHRVLSPREGYFVRKRNITPRARERRLGRIDQGAAASAPERNNSNCRHAPVNGEFKGPPSGKIAKPLTRDRV